MLYEKCYANDSASLCFSAIKGERGEGGGFLQLFFLVVLEERGLLMSNGFERL